MSRPEGAAAPADAPAAPPAAPAAADADALAAQLAAPGALSLTDAAATPAEAESEDEEDDRTMCRICTAQPRRVLWIACGHFVACAGCHDQIMQRAAKCVMCDVRILAPGGVRLLEAPAEGASADVSSGGGFGPVRSFMPEAVDAAAAARARAAPDHPMPRQPPPRLVPLPVPDELREPLRIALAPDADADAAALEAALCTLRRLVASADPAAPLPVERLDVVIQEGLLERCVALLADDVAPALQLEAVSVLTNVAAGEAHHSAAVAAAGAVAPLVRALSCPHADVAEQAVDALGNMTDSMEGRGQLLRAGVVPPLLALLAADVAVGLQRAGRVTWALRGLCHKPLPPQGVAALAPALPVLARLLTSPPADAPASADAPPDANAEVLENVCAALAGISDGHNGQVQMVLDAGCLPSMVQLLSHGEPEVRRQALRVVGNVASGADWQTEQLLEAGALPPLRRLLEDAEQPRRVHKEVCWTISNITAGNVAQRQAVFDAGLLPPLVAALASRDTPFDIRKEVAWALSNASDGSSAQVRALVDAGVVAPMCDLLIVTDARILMVALTCLENVLRVGAHDRDEAGASLNRYAVLVDEAEGLEKLEELQNHTSNDVYEKAVHVMETYFGLEEEEDT